MHICVVFCPYSNQEHVDHTGGGGGGGKVTGAYICVPTCVFVCVLMCECAYLRARMGAYIPSHSHIA